MKKWSKDWNNINWNEIEKKIKKAIEAGEPDAEVGITRDDMLEYISWLREEAPDFFNKIFLGEIMISEGVSVDKSVEVLNMLEQISNWKLKQKE